MSIAGAVKAKEEEVQATKGCKFFKITQAMPIGDQEATAYAVTLCRQQSSAYSAHWLTNVLNVNGYQIGKTAVTDHIAGRCSCERS